MLKSSHRLAYCCCFFLTVLLTSCQQIKPIPEYINPHQDGAPKGPKPTQFKKVHPKNEPLSHYGNPASYRVQNKKYDVLTSAEGYKKQGVASWYGTKFHKIRTSSGEIYDMYALTAAHKTLPLPTYVRVKNLENNREAIVRVNDRGPFHEDRIIDLSYAAAAKLDLLPKGTANVEIEALSFAPKAQYYLQAGAFHSSKKAQTLRDKLLTMTKKTDVHIEKRDKQYIVSLGPFANKEEANASKTTLKKAGMPRAFSYLK